MNSEQEPASRNRRQFLHAAMVSSVSCAALSASGKADETRSRKKITKKGICGRGSKCELVDAGWYYNWTPGPTPGEFDAEFVPMVKGGINATQKTFEKLEKLKQSHGVTHLLGLNEPDSPKQGNLSVEKAVKLWPKLMDTELRLGSPAVTDNAKGRAWFDAFAAQVVAKRLRVDFLCVHRYPNLRERNAAIQFLRSLEQLFQKYRLPIWITEFAGLNFGSKDRHMTAVDNLMFMQWVLPKLEQLPYIERYAWFSGDIATLYQGKQKETLNALGRCYRQY